MKTRLLAALLIAGLSLPAMAAAGDLKEKKEKGPIPPIGWLYLHDGARDFSGSTEEFHKFKRTIPQGSLVPVFKIKQKDGATYGKVASLNLESGYAEIGWVRIDPTELKPAQAYPPDDDLVPQLGAPYLDDVTANHTDIARYLVHQPQGGDLLLCYVLTGQLLTAKLVVFNPSQGKFTLEPQSTSPWQIFRTAFRRSRFATWWEMGTIASLQKRCSAT